MDPAITAEIDRQLSEQRALSDSIVTRAGLMFAATAAIFTLAATRSTAHTTDPTIGYWLLAGASLAGFALFWMLRLGLGPTPVTLGRADEDEIANAKLVLVEANLAVLFRGQVVFTLQVILTIAGVVSLAYMMWNR